jgi:hypothetical protein
MSLKKLCNKRMKEKFDKNIDKKYFDFLKNLTNK